MDIKITFEQVNMFGRMESVTMTGTATAENVKKAFLKLKKAHNTFEVYVYLGDEYTFYYDNTKDLELGIVSIQHQPSYYEIDRYKKLYPQARKFALDLVSED